MVIFSASLADLPGVRLVFLHQINEGKHAPRNTDWDMNQKKLAQDDGWLMIKIKSGNPHDKGLKQHILLLRIEDSLRKDRRKETTWQPSLQVLDYWVLIGVARLFVCCILLLCFWIHIHKYTMCCYLLPLFFSIVRSKITLQ